MALSQWHPVPGHPNLEQRLSMRTEPSLSPSRGDVKRPCWLVRCFEPELDVPSDDKDKEQPKSLMVDSMTHEEVGECYIAAIKVWMPDNGRRVLPIMPKARPEIKELPYCETSFGHLSNLMHEKRLNVHVVDFFKGGCKEAKEVAEFIANEFKVPVHCHFSDIQQGETCGVIAANVATAFILGSPSPTELSECALTKSIRRVGYNPRTCKMITGTKVREIVEKDVPKDKLKHLIYCPWDHFQTWQYLNLLRRLTRMQRCPEEEAANFVCVVNTQEHDNLKTFKHWFSVAWVWGTEPAVQDAHAS